MFPCKMIFSSMFNDLTCRLCGKENETQEHLFNECIYTINKHFDIASIYSDATDKVKLSANRILDISIML